MREVVPLGWRDLECFLNSPLRSRFEEEGLIVSTKILSHTRERTVVEHEKVPFPSYAFEWAPEMLQEAGSLTLELAERSLEDGFGLKDATTYNVLFRGFRPIFVDLLSFERRTPGDPIWLPYAQFVRNFLLPLVLDYQFGVSLKNSFFSSRDGIEPECVYAMSGTVRKLLPPMLTLATIPTLLGLVTRSKSSIYTPRLTQPEKAQFALRRLYRTIRKQLDWLAKKAVRRESIWTSYEHICPYTFPQAVQKRNFVESILKHRRPRRVLDIGCNTGTFSLLAGRLGSSVVAIDSDPAVVGALWEKARAENTDILPLVIDIARPSPAVGWRNLECQSFLSKCDGHFDLVLLLGIVHHLLVTERIPLGSFLEFAGDLTTDGLILEYIGPDDPMFRSLLRGRDHLYEGFNPLAFEQACAKRFRILNRVPLDGCGRILYFLRKTTPAPTC